MPQTSASVLSASMLNTSNCFISLSCDSNGMTVAAQLPTPEYSSLTDPSLSGNSGGVTLNLRVNGVIQYSI